MRGIATLLVELIGIGLSVFLGLHYAWWPQGVVPFIVAQLIVISIWCGLAGVIDAIIDGAADAFTD